MAAAFGEMSTRERQIYAAGVAEGEKTGKPADGAFVFGRSLTSTEFLVTAATTIFTMWVGYRIITDPELDLQRAIAAVTGVVTVAWYYINRRTDLKKTVAEAGTTTIKTPAGAVADAVTLARNGRSRT